MNNELFFSIANTTALISWVLLMIFPFGRLLKKLLMGFVISALAILYVFLIANSFQPSSFESFSTLAGLTSLFNNPTAFLAGWIHYLAFDLMVGLYIAKNADQYGINRFLLIPCLLFTFMLGPVGLLLYFIIRTIYTKRYFHEYE